MVRIERVDPDGKPWSLRQILREAARYFGYHFPI
jgi:hypothetical protein